MIGLFEVIRFYGCADASGIEATAQRDIWSTWDEDRNMGRVTARCFVFDDAMDRVVWAMDRAGDGVSADVAIGAGLPIF
ncbi:hypothetical protein [Burkholderia vietnamiensis]|uniref:hypothetical protein n=1 Tax=Burkholderia vietnamiensis TaxID=60552 RepID=UPI0015940B84|nr:hypothetical protein [Burkholderia vietnamiensis]MCA7945171.1 hypothetical protein [Burkholderia vietnamiensis]HDR8969938.1 hypothetical protein [Burkholderia vietnamiensis]HDR9143090.1 hypothetical protein [Burkholderia vietnamiensis]HDR9219337.1 hypothetical protein [Burkholderia vietnamiensis]